MAELFTQEQARAWLRKNNLKTGKSIQDAFINEIKGVLQEALEEEMNNTLGYSKMIAQIKISITQGMVTQIRQ